MQELKKDGPNHTSFPRSCTFQLCSLVCILFGHYILVLSQMQVLPNLEMYNTSRFIDILNWSSQPWSHCLCSSSSVESLKSWGKVDWGGAESCKFPTGAIRLFKRSVFSQISPPPAKWRIFSHKSCVWKKIF